MGLKEVRSRCVQDNTDEYDCMPALEELNIRVKYGLDNEDAEMAAKALNSLDTLYSADYRY